MEGLKDVLELFSRQPINGSLIFINSSNRI